MMRFLKKYKAFFFGAVVTICILIILKVTGIIIINPKAWVENTLLFLFWWLFISIPIYKFTYIRKQKQLLLKLLILCVLLILIVAIDSTLEIRDNPITISLLIAFWLGVTYVIAPGFFNKYKVPALIVYGAILIYFFYARFGNSYFEVHKERVVSFLLIPIPFFIGLWVFEQWKWVKSLENDKKEAELALLKSQLNPHFFFNTLNNLYGLTVEKSDEAPEIVLKLSDMMRYTIYEGKHDCVPLINECSYLENYIDLHRIRYQKNIEIQFTHDIDKNVEVAPLLFIVLLENAFKHGVESMAENAYIHLNLNTTPNKIEFQIENNFDISNANTKPGIGINNLKHRLNLIYPNRHRFKIIKENNTFIARLEITLV
ncbi:Histidine kinase [Zhouia amylolytica]|uniref:Histidine kinase n=1 Tax=Zhouia amylolytica TaxID=376730 RepID=A0A1I6UNP1_9FLAO|nr:sensor histidine kinase [Zhouia amylolytica]SFT03060.1 Histidine kinase [Zhouia amylolytica]